MGVSLVGKTLAVMGFGKVGSFDEAIATADFISLHMPLTPSTSKILNDENFSKMKKGVRIINVTRGGVIDEDALDRALDVGIVAQAGPALACGCTVVIKPSELTPLTALAAVELAIQSGIPPGVLNIVMGDAPSIWKGFT